jgi:hypothetical protein
MEEFQQSGRLQARGKRHPSIVPTIFRRFSSGQEKWIWKLLPIDVSCLDPAGYLSPNEARARHLLSSTIAIHFPNLLISKIHTPQVEALHYS